MTSSGVGNLDDVEGGTVKHTRHYQVYRGMSPTTSSRLEVPDSAVLRQLHQFDLLCRHIKLQIVIPPRSSVGELPIPFHRL